MIPSLFALYLIKFLLVLALLSGLGKVMLPQKPSAPFYNLFFNCLLTTILIATGFALWKTGGVSIMGGFVLWFGLWFFNHDKANFFFLPNWRSHTYLSAPILIRTALLLLGLSAIFCWAYFSRVQGGAFPFVMPEGTALAANDVHIYALRSYYLGLTGEENYFGVYNTFDPQFHGPKPYHYLELWFNVAILKVFGGLNVLNLSLITGPVFQAMALFGILALWEHYRPVGWKNVVYSIAFLWLAGLFLFYDKIGFPSFSLPIMTYRFKMVVYYPFLIGFAVCALFQDWKKAILMLLGLPLATIVAAPAILGGLFLFSATYWIAAKEKELPLKSGLIYTLILFGFLGLFYVLSGSSTAGTTFEVGQSEMAGHFKLKEPGRLLGNFLHGLLHIALLYAPFGLLYLLFRPYLFIQIKKQQWLFWVSMSIVVSGAAVWSLLYDFAQSSQLFYNLAIPLSNVMGIVLVLLIIKEYHFYLSDTKSWPLIGIVLIILASQGYQVGKTHFRDRGKANYSVHYLQQIDSLVQSKQLSQVGAAIKGAADYTSEYSKMAAGYALGYYLLYMENGYATVSLSDFDIPINPNDRRNNLKDIQSGAFYQFVERHKAANTFDSVEKSQLDFLREEQINFVVVTANGNFPELLKPKIKQELRDSISGERFILLQNL